MGKKQLIALIVFLPTVFVGGWFYLGSIDATAKTEQELALVELRIDKMTCGSCVKTIENSLSQRPGVGEVVVSVTSGMGRFTYDPDKIASREIARLVTDSGYPASIKTELSASEFRAMQREEAQLSRKYIAKIGQRLLSRESYEGAVRARIGQRELTPQLLTAARQETWKELLQQEILLGAAESYQVVVRDEEVDARQQQVVGSHPDFDSWVMERFGGVNHFRDRVKTDLIIQRTIDNYVLSEVPKGVERQQFLNSWYQGLVKNTEVKLFDPQLKAATGTSSGCGGGCCG